MYEVMRGYGRTALRKEAVGMRGAGDTITQRAESRQQGASGMHLVPRVCAVCVVYVIRVLCVVCGVLRAALSVVVLYSRYLLLVSKPHIGQTICMICMMCMICMIWLMLLDGSRTI